MSQSAYRLICCGLIASYSVSGFDIFLGASLRVFAIYAAAILSIAFLFSRRIGEFAGSGLMPILASYLAFSAWFFLCQIHRGEAATGAAVLLGARHFMLVAAVAAVALSIRNIKQAEQFVAIGATMLCLGAAFGIGQLAELRPVWQIWGVLNPAYSTQLATPYDTTLGSAKADIENLVDLGLIRDIDGYAPGLTGFSIAFGFQIVVFAPACTLLALRRWRQFAGWYSLLMLLAVVAAAVAVVSRSVLITLMWAIPLTAYLVRHMRSRDPTQGKGIPPAFILATPLSGIAVAVWLYQKVADSAEALLIQDYIERFYDFSDSTRLIALENGIAAFAQEPLFGPGVAALPIAPHNVIVNTLVYTGLPGLVLLAIFWTVCFRSSMRVVRLALRDAAFGWIGIASAIGFWAFNFRSLFHNDSILLGSVHAAWPLGVMLAYHAIASRQHHLAK